MMGTINCVYETPCGWCSKWDKECDKKIPKREQGAKCNPIDDAISEIEKEQIDKNLTNKVCSKESDHEWECIGVDTQGFHYRCKKCFLHKQIFSPYTGSPTTGCITSYY